MESLRLNKVLAVLSISYCPDVLHAEPVQMNCHMDVCSWQETISVESSGPKDVLAGYMLSIRYVSFSTDHRGSEYPRQYESGMQRFGEELSESIVYCNLKFPAVIHPGQPINSLNLLSPSGVETYDANMYLHYCHGLDLSANTQILGDIGYRNIGGRRFESIEELTAAEVVQTSIHSEMRMMRNYFRVVDVASNDVLNIRSEPSADSVIIGVIPYDAAFVEVAEDSADGKWARVSVGEGAGWIRKKYLSPISVMVFQGTNIPIGLSCSSSEPFITVTFNADHIEYSQLSSPKTILNYASILGESQDGSVAGKIITMEGSEFTVFNELAADEAGRVYPYSIRYPEISGYTPYFFCSLLTY